MKFTNCYLVKCTIFVFQIITFIMNKTEIKRVIISQREVHHELDYVERNQQIVDSLIGQDSFVRIISGIRRCGKSTVLGHIKGLNQGGNFCLNFDDNRLIGFSSDDFELMYESFYELFESENTWYFDEIQLIEGWERFVRRLHNQGHKVYITGSNAGILGPELGTHLTGRYLQVELFPFSFDEYLRFRGVEHHQDDFFSTEKRVVFSKLFDEYLLSGGFPDYLKTRSDEYLQTLFENIVYRDVVTRYGIRHVQTLLEMTHYLITNVAKESSYNALKKTFRLSNAITAKDYISYLEDSYLLFSVHRYDYSLKKQLQNPKKLYCIDNGLGRIVSFQFSENTGRKLENLIFLHLRRFHKQIFYHKKQHECDFIVVASGRVVNAIQVCYSMESYDTRARELEGLMEALHMYHLAYGIIITKDQEEVIERDGVTIEIMPTWKFLMVYPGDVEKTLQKSPVQNPSA